MLDDLKEVVEQATKFEVIIGIQNHGDFLKTTAEAIELLKAVYSEWIGVIVDTGYFLTPDPYIDVAEILPWAVSFPIEEFVRKSPTPFGPAEFHPINFTRLIKIVRNSTYRGYLQIETVYAGKSGPNPRTKTTPHS